jgi:hypothetical protein
MKPFRNYTLVQKGHLIMKQCTTSKYLTRTIHHLEHILAEEDYPAVRAAELLAETLLALAPQLPETEQQIKAVVSLYEQCADRQYKTLSHREQKNERICW